MYNIRLPYSRLDYSRFDYIFKLFYIAINQTVYNTLYFITVGFNIHRCKSRLDSGWNECRLNYLFVLFIDMIRK